MSRGHEAATERRDFLKQGLLAAAGGAVLPSVLTLAAAPDQKEIATTAKGLPMKPFGKTGHVLPILGMGGSAFVKMFIQAYGVPLPPMEESARLVRYAFDQGIRYFDTARVYGESEKIFGQGLAGVRDQVYLATKCHAMEAKGVRPMLEKSLSELNTDYVDCVQIHSPAIEKIGFDGAMQLHAELVKLRDEKLLRFIGLTTHVAFEDVLKMISTGGFDQTLLAYGYFRKGMDTILSHRNLELREMCLAKAHELGMAIVAMKVMGANILGHNAANLVPDAAPESLAKLPPAAIRWVLQDERVSLLNIGVSMQSDLDQNLATLRGDLRYTNADAMALANFSARAYEAPLVKEMQVTWLGSDGVVA
jgi:predicted aldo/keto reductase-like oxidoreductase